MNIVLLNTGFFEYRFIEYCRFKQHSYNHCIYNKDKVKVFIIYSDNNNNNVSTISRLTLPIFSNFDTEDIFFLKDILYMFSIKYYCYSYNKTFRCIEVKRIYEKNKIYIKIAK